MGVLVPERRQLAMPRRPSRRWLGLALLTAALAGVWFGFVQPRLQEDLIAQQLREYQARPGAVTYTLRSSAGEVGTLVRLANNQLFVVLEAPPEANRVYQVWEIRDDSARSLGTFDQRAFFVSEPLAMGSRFGLTQEPPGGSEEPTGEFLTLPLF